MRYLLLFVTLFTVWNPVSAQIGEGFYDAYLDLFQPGIGTYTGTLGRFNSTVSISHGNFLQTYNGTISFDYVGSSISLVFYSGSFEDDIDVCIDASCNTIPLLSDTGTHNSLVEITYSPDYGTHTVTITGHNPGRRKLFDHVIVWGTEIDGDGGNNGGGDVVVEITPEPFYEYLTLESGRVVAIAYTVNGGDIVTIGFLAFCAAMLVFVFMAMMFRHD